MRLLLLIGLVLSLALDVPAQARSARQVEQEVLNRVIPAAVHLPHGLGR